MAPLWFLPLSFPSQAWLDTKFWFGCRILCFDLRHFWNKCQHFWVINFLAFFIIRGQLTQSCLNSSMPKCITIGDAFVTALGFSTEIFEVWQYLPLLVCLNVLASLYLEICTSQRLRVDFYSRSTYFFPLSQESATFLKKSFKNKT